MMEGGWATVIPVFAGVTIFGVKPEDEDDLPTICAFDKPDAVIAEASR